MRTASALLALAALIGTWPSTSIAHQGHVDDALWKVCQGRLLDERCEWVTAEHQRARGTCRQIGGALVCVRNRPLEPLREEEIPRPPDGASRSLIGVSMWVIVAGGVGLLSLLVIRARRSRAGRRDSGR